MKLSLFLFALSAFAASPELAQRGPYHVGVRTIDLVHRAQPDILSFDPATGKAPLYDRPLKVELWYPAILPAGAREATTYRMPLRDQQSAPVEIPGQALRDAAPITSERFPLAIVSHGYPGSRIFLSYLTEHLASRGYIVAAIDHTDSVLGEIRPFPSTLLNRSNDQIFTLNQLLLQATTSDSFLYNTIDRERVAIIGYSMGGYGTLITAGAGIGAKAAILNTVPGGYLKDWMANSAAYRTKLPANLKAIVAIAPWGEQPPYNSWDAEGLAGIHVPSLFIAGDRDDVADYASGIRPAFERATNSSRCLLVFENARHNTGGNPPPIGIDKPADIEFFDEPVWDKNRICDINRHFISAFLDLYVKGDESKRAYLNTLVERSNDGQWPLQPGAAAPAAYSLGDGANGITVWKGFPRRWALGLQLRCVAAK